MSKQTEISASEWLAVRERVVEKHREASPQSQKDTRTRMAERMILAGYVDVEFIAAEMAEAERQKQERIDEARRAREQAAQVDGQRQEDEETR